MDETKNYKNLVLTVKKYPALYDLSCNNYHNRVVRNKIWKAVAQELSASAAECKEKWKNLRASFTRHLRNQNTVNSKSKKRYYMADYMDFLLPYSKFRRPDDSLNEERAIAGEIWNDETASDTSSNYKKLNKSEQKMLEPDRDNDTRNEEHAFSQSKPIKLEDSLQTHSCLDNCILTSRQDHDESVNDADLLFFKSLLPDVRQMTRQEKRNFKISVLDLINKILDEKESSMPVVNDNFCSMIQNQDDEKVD
ncbi:Transcription factor Adf-1 [Habropoda laboriosa]|uniref:Transcription factor Adf-1 n=1 Tax=Habropoda laboriosa TaxID=597456 RepID=A0A0L7QUC5_9HYME|nr:PREDICTED: transcription factor Adf-1-like [Habropoda laboriosa]KOC62164.1 Transcription factor Adf-1 [Habropoda laboriosa]